MAAIDPATDRPNVVAFPVPAEAPRPSLMAEMARLAALHGEAEETAHLANLLGRTPFAACVLALGTGLTTALAHAAAPAAALIAWAFLMLIVLAATGRAYAQAIRAPFERAPLKAFAEDLSALAAFAGFAWGAGAFLALPATTGPLLATLFAVAPAALIALVLRAAGPSLTYLAPAAGLSALAMILRLPNGASAAALTLILAGAISAAAVLAERQDDHRPAGLADLPFA